MPNARCGVFMFLTAYRLLSIANKAQYHSECLGVELRERMRFEFNPEKLATLLQNLPQKPFDELL